jgi:hypothetical protein
LSHGLQAEDRLRHDVVLDLAGAAEDRRRPEVEIARRRTGFLARFGLEEGTYLIAEGAVG